MPKCEGLKWRLEKKGDSDKLSLADSSIPTARLVEGGLPPYLCLLFISTFLWVSAIELKGACFWVDVHRIALNPSTCGEIGNSSLQVHMQIFFLWRFPF